MKKIILVSTILLLLGKFAYSESRSDSAKKMTITTDTIIGKKIALPVLEGYYKDEITEIDLNSYKGKWIILFFYPADFTFVCPTELKELADYYKDFAASDAEIFSISTDSPYVHRAWKKDNSLLKDVRFPMLSDRGGAFSKYMGVYESRQGIAIRATFIIDPEGYVVAAEYSHESIGRNAGELLRKLDAAIAIRKGGGGYCPAGWVPGKEIIKEK
ncbi:MAG TPA: peroxiredoxin [Spirochaetota bacterium]|jgi:peroxiredoxin (alkyl hydroperoxide reductase subunit C)|nr:peroxiredoxin [Spirochaetota bacterium]HOV09620.1 peroxiredoxin [Spirochaetota bacterium]HPP95205.1 peroxiredoxin [Spirochaetota bacterium]HPX90730.1 peroxiredoxin [Spirochaetota bacterium]